jgi:coenzyme F420-reducing hydrogenase beta subunit
MGVKLYNKKDECTGCWACYNICPQNCISMAFDDEGFRYPEIDHEKCISCYKCVNVCPINKNNDTNNYEKPIFYTAISKDKKTLDRSSSGGVFSILAKETISKGGVAYGCILDEDMRAKHIGITSIEQLMEMRGSKYVQSDINESYIDVKKQLEFGKKVLYSGVPCQISGLKHFLGKDYSNLLLVEILCHGVPSPVLFSKHINHLNKKHKGKVVHYEFRSKRKYGWGSENRTYYEINKDGKVKGFHPLFPEYFTAFFYGISLRPSCYKCKYATSKRVGDLTLGDFWGYWAKYKKYFPEGISVVAVNNDKGNHAFYDISNNMILDRVNYDEATKTNIHFLKPVPKMKLRSSFYDDINRYGYKFIFRKVYLEHKNKKQILRTFYGRFIPNKVRILVRKLIEFSLI